MIIDRAAYTAMIEHMREAAPLEGVGLLAGPRFLGPPDLAPQVCDRWVLLRNVAEYPRLRYEVDPEEQLAAWHALDDDGRRPWIACHSHVTTGTAPSPMDVRYAVDPTLLHMIVSLMGPEPVATLWRLHPYARPGTEQMITYQVVDLGF